MKVIEVPNDLDLIGYWLRGNYPDKYVAYISSSVDIYDPVWNWIKDFCEKYGTTETYGNALIKDMILVEFEDEHSAIDFCHSVPDSSPYCCVYFNGEVITENT